MRQLNGGNAPVFWFFTESWGGANKGLGEALKSCTRKEHGSATNPIAKRGQGAIAPCRVKGQRPLWGLGQRPNSSTDNQYAKRAQQRCRQRSVPASNSALPQERPRAALPPRFREELAFSCSFTRLTVIILPSDSFSTSACRSVVRPRLLPPAAMFGRGEFFSSPKRQKIPLTLTNQGLIGIRQRLILPGRVQPSTFSTGELNFCVRDGNRWNLSVIATGNCSY